MAITVETMTPEEACQRMRAAGIKISPPMVREGIKQKVFPFGDAIGSETSCRFFVYTRLFDEWMERRAK